MSRRLKYFLRWLVYLTAVGLVVDAVYLARLWPDWSMLSKEAVPKSRFIQSYEKRQLSQRDWPVLRWRPVRSQQIPAHVVRAILIAEDDRFYEHHGFDLIAIRWALNYNLNNRTLGPGASTISQQTAKNLFLSPSRNPLRKWHEAILTSVMEAKLEKQRILEIYLNIAEFGRGIYGVGAAAQAYWGRPVSALSLSQAAELAASLPSPVKNNPRTRTPFFTKHATKIKKRLYRTMGVTYKTSSDPDGDDAKAPSGNRFKRFFRNLFRSDPAGRPANADSEE